MKETDDELAQLVVEFDSAIIDFMLQYKLHPIEMFGFALARIVAIARETNGEDGLAILLDEAKSVIMKRSSSKEKTTLH